jgi:hypothetical protein
MRIQRAYIGNKIVLQKDPPAPDLGSRDASRLGALTQLLRIHAQELGCFGEVESSQGSVVGAIGYRRFLLA